jgi:two-component system, cell cycle sensor histidine kinase and response regulator CckA
VSVLGRVLVLGEPSGSLAELAAQDSVGLVVDVDRCLAELRTAEPPVELVVIDPSWPRPLASARRIRRDHARVGLAIAVASDEVKATQARLAFLPDVDDVSVVDMGTGAAELQEALAELIGSSQQRRRVRSALDEINRDLAEGGPARAAVNRSTSVSEHYLAALVRHAADTVLSLDPDGRIVTVNEAGERTLGIEAATVEGLPFRELLAEDDTGRLLRLLEDAAAGEAQVDDQLPLNLSHGRQLVLSATAAPVRDDVGILVGLVVIARDVTSERQAERRLRALQKAESLATLATGVAHDFNNLLVQAHGWAELARDDPEDAELVSSALVNILEATGRAAELARSMLAYGGRGRFESTQLRPAGLISDLMPLLVSSVPAKVRLELDLDDDPEVRGDPTQLRQVVLNLVTNAAEAIGDRTGTISIRTHTATQRPHASHDEASTLDQGSRVDADPAYAIIEVEDTGPGIEPDLEERLFDPFFTTKFTGRGLGLAASQGIAHAHGGVITVDGRPGRGARFRVYLPAIPSSRP